MNELQPPITVSFDPDYHDRVAAVQRDALDRFGGTRCLPLSTGVRADCAFIIEGEPDNPMTPCVVKTLQREWYTGNNAETLTSRLLKEASTVKSLAEAPSPLPVEVPRLLWFDESLPYVVLSYIPGNTVSEREIREEFSPDEKRALGQKIGEVIWYFSQVEPPGDTKMTVTSDIFIRNEEQFYEGLEGFKRQSMHRDYPSLYRALMYVADDMQQLRDKGLYERDHFGHSDLHYENLVFDQHQLVGVIDWGYAGLTNPALEAAPIMLLGRRIGGIALETAIRGHYSDSSSSVNYWFGSDVALAEDGAFTWTLVTTLRKHTLRLLLGLLQQNDPEQLSRFKLPGAAAELERAYQLQEYRKKVKVPR